MSALAVQPNVDDTLELVYGSAEKVRAVVTLRREGEVVDLSGETVEVAFTLGAITPTGGWAEAAWEIDRSGRLPVQRVAAAPPDSIEQGKTYGMYVKPQFEGESAIKFCGFVRWR